MKKQERLEAIKTIIRQNRVGSQRQLMQIMAAEGIETTQATLSRDLKVLSIAIIQHPTKGNIYSLPDSQSELPLFPRMVSLPLEAIQSIACSSNLGVLKCLPSYAPSIAMALDASKLPELLGTIAGDDTVLIIMAEGVSKALFQQAMANQFPGIQNAFISGTGGNS